MQKRFESFVSKQIEVLGNDAKAAHEQKTLKKDTNKKKNKFPSAKESHNKPRKSIFLGAPNSTSFASTGL